MMAKQRLNHRLGLSGYTTRLAAYGDRLVPPVCLLCYSAPDIGHGLCSHCQSSLPINHNPCPVCALPDHGPLPCRRCRENPPPYRAIVAPFVYAKPISHLIRHLKFRQRLELIRPLTELWLEAVAPMVEHPMRLIPVPMDHRSLRERGFNAAIEIARVIGRHLSISTDVKRVVKVRRTPAQSTLSAKQRARIRSGVFQCIAPTTEGLIAVVDDVVTSTKTARAVAGCLLTDNDTSVVVWAIARTTPHRLCR